jgi:uncharacterized protein (DUF952 family)
MTELIYHLARKGDFAEAAKLGSYAGSDADRADGFLHFSTASQIRDSAAKHRAGEAGLILLEADPAKLGSALRWEISRGGQSFPHLYGALPLDAVTRTAELPLDSAGGHVFPEWL